MAVRYYSRPLGKRSIASGEAFAQLCSKYSVQIQDDEDSARGI